MDILAHILIRLFFLYLLFQDEQFNPSLTLNSDVILFALGLGYAMSAAMGTPPAPPSKTTQKPPKLD